MKARPPTMLFLLSLLALSPLPSRGRGISSPNRGPNIILFLVDDLGIGDLGCYGNDTIRTPNVDKLAREGVILTHHLSAAPLCTPSRAALLTGRYPARYGLVTEAGLPPVIVHIASQVGLPENETTIAEVLSNSGYVTAFVGKWHLGSGCSFLGTECLGPLRHGFDSFYGLLVSLTQELKGEHPFWQWEWGDRVYQALIATVVTGISTVLWLMKRHKKFSLSCLALCLAMLALIPPTWLLYTHYGLHTSRWWQVSPWMDQHMNGVVSRGSSVVRQPIQFESLFEDLVGESVAFIQAQGRRRRRREKEEVEEIEEKKKEVGKDGIGRVEEKKKKREEKKKMEKEEKEEVKEEVNEEEDAPPFFLFHSFTHVHTPMFSSSEGSRHGRYGDNVEEMDRGVGFILAALEEANLSGNTLVYLTSDHGGHLEAVDPVDGQRIGGYNKKFKGGKGMGAAEGAIRVPGVLRWPGVIPEGASIGTPTSLLDILPTFVELAGIRTPETEVELDGQSFAPLLRSPLGSPQSLGRRVLLHHCGRDIHGLRLVTETKIYKMYLFVHRWQPQSTQCGWGVNVMCECFGAQVSNVTSSPVLYELLADPYEDRPLDPATGEYETVVGELRSYLEEWRRNVTYPPSQYNSKLNTMHSPWLQPFKIY